MNTISVFAGSVGALAIASAALATPYESMTMDYVTTSGYGDTYRLYANIADGARIDAVYGNSVASLSIGLSSGSFYQNALGGPTSTSINSAFFPLAPSVEFDSYVSIGALYQDGTPFGANNLNNIGIDWTIFESGGDLTTDNGSWFVTPDDAQGGEVDGSVFIGQFTIAGGGDVSQLIGSVNLQGKDANGDTWNAIGATWVPAPGALALLGLAGIAGGRRRRA